MGSSFFDITILLLSGHLLATIVVLFFFTRLNTPYRIIAVQVAGSFVIEMLGRYMKLNGMSNTWLYNYYILIENALLLWASYLLINKRNYKAYYIAAVLLLAGVWGYAVARNSINVFAIAAYIVSSSVLIVAYLLVLYHSAMRHKDSLLILPQIWLCIGIIVFYGCNIPYFSSMQYLINHCTKEQNNYLSGIIFILSNIRYIFIGISCYIYCAYSRNTLADTHGVR